MDTATAILFPAGMVGLCRKSSANKVWRGRQLPTRGLSYSDMRVLGVEMVGAVVGRMRLLRRWKLSSAVVAEAVAVRDFLHAAL